jgi:diguanylate cyclase (GGDEF)-like protein
MTRMSAVGAIAPPSATQTATRPRLLVLVYGVFLVLIAVTASALLAITSDHIQTASLQGVVSKDRALVALFVRDHLSANDLAGGSLSVGRAVELREELAALASSDEILSIVLMDADGRIVAADRPRSAAGPAPSASLEGALAGRPQAELLAASEVGFVDDLVPPRSTLVQEYLPVLANGKQLGTVALWRDAATTLMGVDKARRDVLLVTLTASAILAVTLFVLFRTAHLRLARQQRRLIRATREDPLTGLLNHGAIVAMLTAATESTKRGSDRVGVAIVDIDNFRLLNDTHGHAAGDVVLRKTAELLPRGSRDGDHVARYGPDEFLIVRAGADVAEMERVTTLVREHLSAVDIQFGDSENLPVTVSIGVAVMPDHATAVTELLAAAASAVGEAKQSGGDQSRTAQAVDPDAPAGNFSVLQGLVIAVDHKDRYTRRHSEDVARYAVFLGRLLDLDDRALQSLHLSGLLHDVGKIAIPDAILRKPGKLTADEYEAFKQHVALGDAIVRDVPNLDAVRAGIRTHHERWDGRGYLQGMSGDEIPIIGRILAVADAFSAMTTTRPYRKAIELTEALDRLGDAAGAQLDTPLVTAFIKGMETAADAPLPGDEVGLIWLPNLKIA